MRLYAFDYKKACRNQNDFEFNKLDYEKIFFISKPHVAIRH